MFLKALILLATVAAGALAQLTPKCPSADLNSCTYQYFSNFLNYPHTDNNTLVWTDYSTFINFTDQLVTQNVGDPSGLITVCNALEQTEGCLAAKTDRCFGPLAFLLRGNDATTSFTFSGLFNLYKFRCGAGLYTVIRENLSCVQRTLWNQRNILWGCLNTYQNNVAHDPAGSCNYVQAYTSCYSAVFNRSSCGFAGSADHWWACEGAYQFTLTQFPNCYLSCSREFGPPGFSEYLETHVKVENGRTWFKLPNIWRQINNEWKFVENDWVTGEQ
ncbi:hypothetical protein FO519_000613 [Halicephalobus sp. NKZ332]|nr:hypothetical protein FO519_000613 [Halicephalobus sp. NKZ332]